jgi:hypothetical protein
MHPFCGAQVSGKGTIARMTVSLTGAPVGEDSAKADADAARCRMLGTVVA